MSLSRGSKALTVAVALLFAAAPTRADVWDTPSISDNSPFSSGNVPVHGAVQVHDLSLQAGFPDQDWYSISIPAYSSFEAIIDGVTGDTGGIPGALSFDWLANDAITILASGEFLGSASCFNCSQTARLANPAGTPLPVFIRVMNAACGLNCDTDDQYTFRLNETTYSVPRFNNAAGQTTVLILYNVSEFITAGTIHLFNGAGALLGQLGFALAPNAHMVSTRGPSPAAPGWRA